MNIQEVIESGIIELYVMNALPEDEAARVEALALAHPEIRMEIEDAQTVLEKYAQSHAVVPKPSLKDDILRKIKDELPQNTTTPSDNISTIEKPPLSIKPLWMALAAVALMPFIRACGCGLRTTAMVRVPGRTRSSMYAPSPVIRCGSSRR